MQSKKKSQAPREGLAFRIAALALSNPNNSETISEVQASYLAARYRLTPAVAATVASLAWGAR